MNLALKVAAGIIPVVLVGCSGSKTGPVMDAGPTAGATSGTQTSTGVTQTGAGGSGVAGAGGATGTGGDTGGSSDAGGKASTTASSVTAGTSAAGAAGSASTSGMSSSTAGGQGGKSTIGTGGAFTGASSALGGSALGGKTSSTTMGGSANLGGSLGGFSAGAGTTTVGTRTGPSFPARFVGNLDALGKIRPDFDKYWDQFTPENAGRWAAVQGASPTTFRWDSLDAMYQYTEEHNIVFKESCFIAGGSPPGWLNKDDMIESAKAWMTAFCDRYPNTRLIDVVEEPLHGPSVYPGGLGGGNGTTWEWVANSFKMAREACPHAVLILNDYNICEYESDHQKFLELMNAIKKLDAPIDAIGCEGHDAAKVTVSKFKGYLDTLASQTGLPIYITEFDIGLADDEQQRKQYADYFTMFWDNPNVKGATVYGYVVGQTWRSNTGILRQDGTMRPAMTWLMDFLKR